MNTEMRGGNSKNMKLKVPGNARAIEKHLAEQFSFKHVHVQSVSRSGENDQLLQIDFSGIGVRMTVAGLRRLCDDVSVAVGGTLYGTVNLDYSGDAVLVEIIVELE